MWNKYAQMKIAGNVIVYIQSTQLKNPWTRNDTTNGTEFGK